MGPEYVNTLERLFVVFYSMGSTLASLVHYHDYFVSSTEVQQSLSIVFSNVVRLVVGVASQFGQAKSSQSEAFPALSTANILTSSAASSTAISSEIYRNYGGLIESTYARRDQIFNMLWHSSITTEVGVNGISLEQNRKYTKF